MIRYVLRPCWVTGLSWLITVLVCPWLSADWQIALIAVGAAVLTVSLCVPAVRKIRVIPLVAAVCLLATVGYRSAYRVRVQPTDVRAGETVSLSVQVTEGGKPVLLEVQDGDLPKGTKLIFYPQDLELALKQYDHFSAAFAVEAQSEGSVLSRLMRRAGGTWLRVQKADLGEIEATLVEGDVPWTDCFRRARERLCSAITQYVDGDIGAVITGICYGADEQLSAEAVSHFRACGVSHLFAVSGLHMTVLLSGLLFLLHRFRIRRVWRAVIGAVLLLAFMAVVGFSASVVRAGVVNLIVLFGSCLRRRADTRNSLGIALLVLLVADPFAAYDAGLLLSFTATFGLLCWTEPIRRFLLGKGEPKRFVKFRKGIAAAVAVSLAATLATLPVLAVYFGRISLVSVPANLLTTLAAEAVLIVGCLASLFSVLGLAVFAQPLLLIAGCLSRYLLWICEKISDFSLAMVAIDAPFLLLWLVGAYALFLLSRRVLDKEGLAALCGIGVCTLCMAFLLNRGVTFDTLQIGCASDDDDLAVILSYRGSTVVVTAPENAAALYGITDMLDTFGASHMDALFVIGGDEPALSYVPSLLGEFITDGTQVVCPEEPCRITLGESITAQWHEERLRMEWGGQTLLFAPKSEAVGTADAVFGTGDTRMWVYADGALRPLAADTRYIRFKNGQWQIEG